MVQPLETTYILPVMPIKTEAHLMILDFPIRSHLDRLNLFCLDLNISKCQKFQCPISFEDEHLCNIITVQNKLV